MKNTKTQNIAMLALLLFLSSNVFGQEYQSQGKVASIVAADVNLAGPDTDWVAVEGFTTAGSCGTDGTHVIMRLRDDSRGNRQLSIAMSAYMAGKTVLVSVDDTVKDASGSCFLRWLKL